MQSWIAGEMFSDAYTESSIFDLIDSISKLGNLINWSKEKVSLARKLAGLVFENCYFETPNGIMQQTQGFPMGGHSSREGLDNILLSRELDLLSGPSKQCLLSYYRMVDDISIILNGPFTSIMDLLGPTVTWWV